MLWGALLVAIFPIYVAIALTVLVVRIALIPVVFVMAALEGDAHGFKDFMKTTAGFPWPDEYTGFWRSLFKWQETGKT